MRTTTSIVATVIRRFALVAPLFLSLAAGVVAPASAQFLCSAGTRDGLDCAGDEDCTGGGACVIPLGVCSGGESDGFFCACPSSECAAEPVCPDDGGLGLCVGGVFEDICCDVSLNCFDGSPCASTQKLCLAGENKGFPCISNAHCPGSLCRSTGLFCEGGDFEAFACVDDFDCPDSECIGAAPIPTTPALTRTPTPTRPTPTITPTLAATATTVPTTPGTPPPTLTGTPPTTGPTATRTATRTEVTTVGPTATPQPTRTPSVGQFAMTVADAAAGTHQLVIDLPIAQRVSYPVEGVIEVLGQRIGFTRRRTSNVLSLTAEDGLPFSLSAGSVILVVEGTPRPPRPGGVIVRNEQGGTCAIQPVADGSGSLAPLLFGVVALVGARRFRRPA